MEKNHSENEQQANEKPFILNFLEYYEGAMSTTTSGRWDDIDSADYDCE